MLALVAFLRPREQQSFLLIPSRLVLHTLRRELRFGGEQLLLMLEEEVLLLEMIALIHLQHLKTNIWYSKRINSHSIVHCYVLRTAETQQTHPWAALRQRQP